ncbi:RIP metalloprotease RseP [bacterium]|nr:RIP metalloprotease RseP [bacterium]
MSIIIMILLLSFLVLVHEAGHFFAARAFNIKVSKFGFGLPIGPTLWSKKVGDVEVLVHAFLLGGYVSFPDDEKDSDLPADSEERFINKPVWQRMVVISAGVIANIITAFVLVFLTAVVWGKLPSGTYQVYVGNIVAEKGESVWQSGMQKGDKVLKVNGSDINSSYAFTLYAQNSKQFDDKVDEKFVQTNLEKLKTLNPKLQEDEVIQNLTVVALPKIESEPEIKIDNETLKGYKLYKDEQQVLTDAQKDLRDSLIDKTVYVGDGTVTLKDVAYAISDNYRPFNTTVLRDGKEITLKSIYPNKKGVIGIELEARQVLVPTKNVFAAIKGSSQYLWEQTYILVYGLWQLFTGKVPLKDLHGIVVITKIGGDVIQNSGFFSGLLLTAMISLDLALVNFLPIPALDGGHFMFLLIEKLRGKPVDEETINKVSSFFFILLIVFMVLVVFNDIYALVQHKL